MFRGVKTSGGAVGFQKRTVWEPVCSPNVLQQHWTLALPLVILFSPSNCAPNMLRLPPRRVTGKIWVFGFCLVVGLFALKRSERETLLKFPCCSRYAACLPLTHIPRVLRVQVVSATDTTLHATHNREPEKTLLHPKFATKPCISRPCCLCVLGDCTPIMTSPNPKR